MFDFTGERITVHLPKRVVSIWFPGVRFSFFFHSANTHVANIVSHCSDIGGKIAKCNCSILWWRKKFFLSYMSCEFLVLFSIFFPLGQLYVIAFQMELYLQSFKSLFGFAFVLSDFIIYVWCCCLQYCYIEKRNFEMNNKILDLTVCGFVGIF